MTEPEPRRRRLAISCTLCRKRKIRCDKGNPCNNCLKSRNGVCVYGNQSPQTTRQGQRPELVQDVDLSSVDKDTTETLTFSRNPSSAVASSISTPSRSSGEDVEWMKSRIKQLEEKLSKASQTTNPSSIPTSKLDTEITSSIGGTFHVQYGSRLFGKCQIINGSMMHKSRLFGQSHWCNSMTLFLDILQLIEPHVAGETSKAFSGLQKCKYVAKVIKSKRTPSWPTIPKSDLPAKDLADKLIECYLRTTETVYRILHIPSFQKDYEALWQPNHEPTELFLVQVKLVLAIGAITYDENFSLRSSAIQWVYEAHTWFSNPDFKSGLSIQSLQTSVLLLLARELVGVGEKLVWITAGSLLRVAVYLGLHRDQAYLPKRTVFAAEMRRRLWNTILELALQSSISLGGPPRISLDDFDTEPPGNFDDDQLMDEAPIPKPVDDFTQMSTAIALRKTFPVRLAITKFLNDIQPCDAFDKVLRLDSELRDEYKTLFRTLKVHKIGPRSPSQFEIAMVELIMQHYLSSLHIPFFEAALQEASYAFSRKAVMESSLKTWRLVYPSKATHRVDSPSQYLPLLTVCGSGFFRAVAFQASFLLSVELKTQLQEESLGLGSLRPDLYPILEDIKKWSLQAIEAGETNIKGYLMMCLMSVPIDGLMQGIPKEDFPSLLVKAAEDVVDQCLPMLEQLATLGETEQNDFLDQMSFDMTLQLEPMEDWDFMMSDTMFNVGNSEQMGWMFDETSQW